MPAAPERPPFAEGLPGIPVHQSFAGEALLGAVAAGFALHTAAAKSTMALPVGAPNAASRRLNSSASAATPKSETRGAMALGVVPGAIQRMLSGASAPFNVQVSALVARGWGACEFECAFGGALSLPRLGRPDPAIRCGQSADSRAFSPEPGPGAGTSWLLSHCRERRRQAAFLFRVLPARSQVTDIKKIGTDANIRYR